MAKCLNIGCPPWRAWQDIGFFTQELHGENSRVWLDLPTFDDYIIYIHNMFTSVIEKDLARAVFKVWKQKISKLTSIYFSEKLLLYTQMQREQPFNFEVLKKGRGKFNIKVKCAERQKLKRKPSSWVAKIITSPLSTRKSTRLSSSSKIIRRKSMNLVRNILYVCSGNLA